MNIKSILVILLILFISIVIFSTIDNYSYTLSDTLGHTHILVKTIHILAPIIAILFTTITFYIYKYYRIGK